MGKKYRCSVLGCNSRTADFPGDFYCFPKNPTTHRAWVEACQRTPETEHLGSGEGGSIQDGQWVPNTAARSVTTQWSKMPLKLSFFRLFELSFQKITEFLGENWS